MVLGESASDIYSSKERDEFKNTYVGKTSLTALPWYIMFLGYMVCY